MMKQRWGLTFWLISSSLWMPVIMVFLKINSEGQSNKKCSKFSSNCLHKSQVGSTSCWISAYWPAVYKNHIGTSILTVILNCPLLIEYLTLEENEIFQEKSRNSSCKLNSCNMVRYSRILLANTYSLLRWFWFSTPISILDSLNNM